MKLFCSILFIVLTVSCSGPSKLYTGNKAFETGSIQKSTLDHLRSYLSTASNKPVKDTIIIKFDFNYETCWDLLDRQPDSVVQENIDYYENYLNQVQIARPHISVYLFRETGTNFNKIKSLNKDIIIDDGFLRQLFFKDKAMCGSSVIVDPLGRFLIRKSDSHFEALRVSEEEFSGFFKNSPGL